MSCIYCEENPLETYVRIERANVKIVGCHKHLKILIEKLRESNQAEAYKKGYIDGGINQMNNLMEIRDSVMSKYIVKEIDGEEIIGTFDNKRDAEIYIEEEGIDYDFYEIVLQPTPTKQEEKE